MGVKPLGLVLRRNPVGKRHHEVGGEAQVLAAHNVEERDTPSSKPRTIHFDQPMRCVGGHQASLTRASRQHEACFLEGLARCCHHKGALEGGGRRRGELAPCRIFVLPVDLAARKYQRTGGKIDLVMAHYHENFEPLPSIAQNDDRGRRACHSNALAGVAHQTLSVAPAGNGNASRYFWYSGSTSIARLANRSTTAL